jgi:DNA-binding beta-propeller fold protein YncE
VRRSLAFILAAALVGCGSSDTLPPPPTGVPDELTTPDGARLDTRSRELTVDGETADAGVGPAGIAETEDHVYVTDNAQGALLVFRRQPELVLSRRAHLPGEPSGIAVDEDRELLWIAVTGEDQLVAVTLDGAVKEVVRLATANAPRAVTVREDGSLEVAGDDGTQTIKPTGV